MNTLPILEIIFAIIMSFLPEGTKEFTLTWPMMNPEPLICKLEDNGTWTASSKKGEIVFEGWKSSKTKVIKSPLNDKPRQDVDLSSWITQEDANLLIQGKPIKMETTKDNVLFFTTSLRYLGIFRVEIVKMANKAQ